MMAVTMITLMASTAVVAFAATPSGQLPPPEMLGPGCLTHNGSPLPTGGPGLAEAGENVALGPAPDKTDNLVNNSVYGAHCTPSFPSCVHPGGDVYCGNPGDLQR